MLTVVTNSHLLAARRLMYRCERRGHPLLSIVIFLLAMTLTSATEIFAQNPPVTAATAPPTEQEQHKLETQKLDLETRKLSLELIKLQGELPWITSVPEWAAAVFTPIAVALVGIMLNKRLQDQKEAEEKRRLEFGTLIDDRVRAYAVAYEKLSPTAIFFPRSDACPDRSHPGPGALQSDEPLPGLLDPAEPPEPVGPKSPQLGREECVRMGRELSSWYFGYRWLGYDKRCTGRLFRVNGSASSGRCVSG